MLSLDEAERIAVRAQRNALGFGAEHREYVVVHREQAVWRQRWEKELLDRRDVEGLAPLDGKVLDMLSEEAYRDAHGEEWERYLALHFALDAAREFAGVASAAAQATAMHENLRRSEELERLQEGWARRRELEPPEPPADDEPEGGA